MNNNNLTEEQIILNDITEDIMDIMEYASTGGILPKPLDVLISSIYVTLWKGGYIKYDTTK